jgi:coenzyme F420-reducing hydrogenase delta subunit
MWESDMTEQNDGYDPKVVGFLCNWCCYAGADLAGVSRFQYPTNVRIIRVMCSGTIEPEMVLEAFINGADGVFIGGCHIGDCHYATGNHHTEQKVNMMKRLLARSGFDPERLRLEWVSAAEGQRFSEVMQDFTGKLAAMGPSEVRAETTA